MSTFNSYVNFETPSQLGLIGQVNGGRKLRYGKELVAGEWNWEVDSDVLLLSIEEASLFLAYVGQEVKEDGHSLLYVSTWDSPERAEELGFLSLGEDDGLHTLYLEV